MQETAAELEQLRAVMARSIDQAGPFLRRSFEMPEHSLAVERLLEIFTGVRTVALATATRDGAPRVAPIGCLLVGGRFYIPTTRTSARYRMVQRQPRVSLTLFEGIDLAVIVHGQAEPVDVGSSRFDQIEAVQLAHDSAGPRGWGEPGDGCYLAIEPETVLTYIRHP